MTAFKIQALPEDRLKNQQIHSWHLGAKITFYAISYWERIITLDLQVTCRRGHFSVCFFFFYTDFSLLPICYCVIYLHTFAHCTLLTSKRFLISCQEKKKKDFKIKSQTISTGDDRNRENVFPQSSCNGIWINLSDGQAVEIPLLLSLPQRILS